MSENTNTKKTRRSFTWDEGFHRVEIDFLTTGKKTFTLSELPADILHRCVAHGLEQKLRDNMAMSKAEAVATTDAEYLSMTEALWEQLKAGEWNKKKEGGKRGPSVTLSDLEAKFVEGVKAGLMTAENAKSLYTLSTNKPWTLDDSVFEEIEVEEETE